MKIQQLMYAYEYTKINPTLKFDLNKHIDMKMTPCKMLWEHEDFC